MRRFAGRGQGTGYRLPGTGYSPERGEEGYRVPGTGYSSGRHEHHLNTSSIATPTCTPGHEDRTLRPVSFPGPGSLVPGPHLLTSLRIGTLIVAMLAVLAPQALVAAGNRADLAIADLPALRLETGGLARRQLVAIGRDLVVEGEAMSHVVAVDGSVEVIGRVGGDVITLGGDVHLSPGARVEGDIFVLGGRLEAAPDAFVGGRSVSYPGVSGAFLAVLEAPALGLSPTSPTVVGVKLALLTGWMALLLVLFATSGREMLSTSRCVIEEPLRAFGIGLTFVLAALITLVALNLAVSALLGVPFVFLLLLVAVLAKLWGMAAVFHALGVMLARRFGRRRMLPLTAATIGLIALGTLKFLPLVGLWVWWLATFVGIGATLVTKFGRREPWIPAAQPIVPALS